MKILIFQKIIPHYRVPIFSCLANALNITVCHGKELPNTFKKDIKDNLPFSHFSINNFYLSKKKATVLVQNVLPPLLRFKPDVVIAEFALGIFSNYLLLCLKLLFRYKFLFWSHGYDRRKGFNPKKSYLDKIRTLLMDISDGVIVYSEDDKNIITPWVKKPDSIFVAPNTIHTDLYVKIRKKCENNGKQKLKEKWGIKSKKNIVFIGRLVKDKRVDFLIDVYDSINKSIRDCGLIVVGNGPEKNNLSNQAKILGLKNIYFMGEINDIEKSGEILYISDVMVNPGYVGLSVVHSFCFDLPVITQETGLKGPFHSPEVTYIKQGKTGFFTANNDKYDMRIKIIDLLSNNEMQKQIKLNIRKLIKNECSVESMITSYTKAIISTYYNKKAGVGHFF
jgi:glycosyltransferase involved in cell wall biosynthesis